MASNDTKDLQNEISIVIRNTKLALTRDVFKLIVGDLAENLCIGVIDNGDQRYVVRFSNKGLITV